MELEIEPTEEVTAECTCEPFVLVRYRDLHQEPSFVDNVDEINYFSNDDWLVLIGKNDAGEREELLVARSSEVLSVERVG